MNRLILPLEAQTETKTARKLALILKFVTPLRRCTLNNNEICFTGTYTHSFRREKKEAAEIEKDGERERCPV